MAEEDIMFQEAVEALREGDKAKAKELLTKLLKEDQNNALYWNWLSAAVESTKERIYCLKTALQLDPENATAKRGLIILGALPPDESAQPFPLNRPRLWEEKLTLASELPKEKKTFKSVITSPVGRLAGFGVAGIAVIALVVFGLILPNSNRFTPSVAKTTGHGEFPDSADRVALRTTCVTGFPRAALCPAIPWPLRQPPRGHSDAHRHVRSVALWRRCRQQSCPT